mgnify:CR=1 FL=1
MTSQIEMVWVCLSCKSTVLGRHKSCTGCGRRKTRHETFIMPSETQGSDTHSVVDSALLEKAALPPDLQCEFCGAMRWADGERCENCGGSDARGSDARGSDAQPDNDISADVEMSKAFRPKWKRCGLVVGGVLGLAVVSYLVLRPHVEGAKVDASHWVYTVSVERFHSVHDEGFNAPFGAENVTMSGARVHHYVAVPNGFHSEFVTDSRCGQVCTPRPQVCQTVPRSCTSNRNGFATCTGGGTTCSGGGTSCVTRSCSVPVQDYRNDPVFMPWFSWDVWRWDHQRDVVTEGNSVETWWASDEKVALRSATSGREDERISERKEKYDVTFITDSGKVVTYHPDSRQSFIGFRIGDRHRLKIGLLGVDLVNKK